MSSPTSPQRSRIKPWMQEAPAVTGRGFLFPLRVANDARHPGLLRREQQGKTTNPPVALPTALAWTEDSMHYYPAYVNMSYFNLFR